ncbi:16S rRNA (uracil1498-N3)-methyltransferase [Thalassobacillus cyri]|uniref:Ribosomal RNA small subunit methyltransferase E n=1 Tax=Thalassobacillus cyri TaxID=571932 RepID=A0A1H4FGA2_9BACI|nr:16S rRNA (uracil(1498)-N(3))-methyltransferase [Thalassobacillus cyri]SEA96403.1 16S rRNA (uracil1498-N3)-methyltransferase [Thalassobacillus cyri]
MQRYFVEADNWQGDKVFIQGEDVHHIGRVMRMLPNDEIICNHPSGNAARCQIVSVEKEAVHCRVVEWLEENVELPIEITLVQSLGKGDKLETVVQKGTELGASRFIPYQAERSVVKWDKKKADKKISRLEKIAKEASEQCHRNKVPEIEALHGLDKLLQTSKQYTWKLFAHEDEAKRDEYKSLSNLVGRMEPGESLLAVIGPEGGFSASEVLKLSEAGFHSVRLGPRILRMETAPLYLLASISYHLEELR